LTTGKANRHDLAFLSDNAAGRGLQVPLGRYQRTLSVW
jgi:hypothetical protein